MVTPAIVADLVSLAQCALIVAALVVVAWLEPEGKNER